MSSKVIVTKEKLDSIATNIVNQAGSSGKKTIDQLITLIDGIESTDGISKIIQDFKSISYLFYGFEELTDSSNWLSYSDTANVEDFSYAFAGCTNLITWFTLDMSNATTTERMFSGCSNLEYPNYFNLPKVYELSYMFNGCKKITSIKLNTPNSAYWNYTFDNCYYLETIDISFFGQHTPENIGEALYGYYTKQTFYNCYSLKKLIIREFDVDYEIRTDTFGNCYHLDGTVNATYNPNGDKDCYIYVPDNMVETIKTTSGWSTYAEQIKPLSEL